MRRAWLIAEREIRFYGATFSFWIALACGPIAGAALAAALAFAARASGVAVTAPDPALARAA
ncbi:MAG TPA: hypothetical protein VGS12_06680, partial [Caulobacteraceae bacterium]|nr:hypothetical protein [Caulobacteraceae bacterium]